MKKLLTTALDSCQTSDMNDYHTENHSHLSNWKGEKMGNIKIDLANVITISLVAFLGVWLINKGLEKTNLSQWKA